MTPPVAACVVCKESHCKFPYYGTNKGLNYNYYKIVPKGDESKIRGLGLFRKAKAVRCSIPDISFSFFFFLECYTSGTGTWN